MGADLYIWATGKVDKDGEPSRRTNVGLSAVQGSNSKGKEGMQRRIGEHGEHVFSAAYFRDSYNLSSVLWTCGLSWWQDVLPLLNNNLELTGENLARFRKQFVSAEQRLPTAEELEAQGVRLRADSAACRAFMSITRESEKN